MSEIKNILIIQTAFLGDLVLTLPLLQVVRESFSESEIDLLVIPSTAGLLKNNVLLNRAITYDKRSGGLSEFMQLAGKLKKRNYDLVICPHRSARSAALCSLARPKLSIAFNTSAMAFLFDKRVKYMTGLHEIQRNLSLLKPLGIERDEIIRPELFIDKAEEERASEFLKRNGIADEEKYISIAPGSVWFTKRYPAERFAQLITEISSAGLKVVLIGGKDDVELCEGLASLGKGAAYNAAGLFSPLESAALIKRSALLITNDSAPLHLANAVSTRVFAVFGSTVTGFGFFPYGNSDIVFQAEGLECRPCGIHGRTECPKGTLECMNAVMPSVIAKQAIESVGKVTGKAD